jgi:Domain of unknown function (DUF4157)
MLRKTLALSLLILLAINVHPALACDPNEDCSTCLASAFGHCIQEGNDPRCEVRKAACQNGISVPNPSVRSPGDVQNCLANLSGCPAQILARIGYDAVRPILDNYIAYLQNQAGNNLFPIDESIIGAIQQFYTIDLHAVRYATNINTIHGANVTIGNTIYFVRNMNFGDPNDLWTLAHELEHVVQYANRGGVEPFLAEYVLKGGGSLLKGGNSIYMHDNIDLESAANAKANQVRAAINYQPNQPPPGTGTCQTNYVGCRMSVIVPIGSPCFCPTQTGNIQGVVVQ